MDLNFTNPKLPVIWHGGDYNPDQWLDYPEILKEDIRLMKKAKCNVMSIGIFAWSALEPEDGVYKFDWLDRIFDEFEKNDLYIDLATPSGARPPWLTSKYPEVLRVDAERRRHLFGGRHNHCFTSPEYRKKIRVINEALAKRYAGRKALILWHISNELRGEGCHCPLCQQAFREFLKARYGSLEALNKAWWTSFWSHVYTAWEQIESPSPIGENRLHGLKIDWNRFVTAQTVDFIKNEIAPLRKFTPDVPITTNFMGNQPIELNLQKLADSLDIVSWDSYPPWHSAKGDFEIAQHTAMLHDLTRSFKRGKPFLMMESTPSITNFQTKQMRPGMQKLASILAVASGSDSVIYFQWRKSRGSAEKFHGAVVGHEGHENTRTFKDVAETGAVLEMLKPVTGSLVDSKTAIIADWENWWGINECQALNREHKDYWEFVLHHHKPFFKMGIATDLIQQEADFSHYKLIIAPMLYMLKPGVTERLETFVSKGGTLVLSFWSGLVDENDLCFLSGAPGPLRKLAGIWAEELDSLYNEDSNSMTFSNKNSLGLVGTHGIKNYCEVIHSEGAEVLASYDSDYYKGMPALTVNKFGTGQVYYLAVNGDEDFLFKFHSALSEKLGLFAATSIRLPEGVIAKKRIGANGEEFLFIMNFTPVSQSIIIDKMYQNIENGESENGPKTIPPYGVLCLASHP